MEAKFEALDERAALRASPEHDERQATRGWVSGAFARSVRDNALAEFAAQLIRFAGIAVLARALEPADFGILKALLAISLVTAMFIEGGIPDAVIQRKDLSLDHLCTAWWMSIAVTTVVVAMVFLGAGTLASWMKMPRLEAGIQLVSLPIFIEGTSMLSSARLQRRLRFGALALADVLAEVAFLLCAIGLLLGGLPRWSLIGGLAARFAVHGATVWLADAWIPPRRPRLAAFRDLRGFAFTVWGARIVQAAAFNADSLLIARALGSAPLGIYGMARDLLRFVPNRLHKVAGRVTFSAFSALQDDDEALAHTYVRFFNSIARIVLPVIAGMAVAAPDLVTTVYGTQWSAAVLPLQLLACGLAFAGMNVASTSIYYAKNRPDMDIHLNLLRLALVVAAIVLFRHAGLAGVAAGLSLAEIINALVAQYAGSCFAGFTLGELLGESLPGVRLAVACSLLTALGEGAAHYYGLRAPTALLLAGVPTVALYLIFESSTLRQMLQAAFAGQRPDADIFREP